jgi:hypothetical protein
LVTAVAVQSCGRFGESVVSVDGVTGGLGLLTLLMLTAARRHRDKVACEMPVSCAKLVAVTASGPSIRRTIRAFTFSAYSIIEFRLTLGVWLIRPRRQLP